MMLSHNALVAVADGKSLALFRNAGNEARLDLVPLPAPALRAVAHPSGGRHRSSSANPASRLQEEDGYAAAVANWLNRQSISNRFEQFVVIAPARTLGEIRRHYDPHFQAHLAGEIGKELADQTADIIEAAIAAH